MKIVGRSRLQEFCREFTEARAWVECWLAEVEEAEWQGPQDVLARYTSASLGEGKHIRFFIGNTSYSILVLVPFRTGVVVIKWIGEPSES
jgi:mRNA interferase HigB